MLKRSHPAPAPAARRQRGVALIEALVSALLFMVGVLSLVGLQAGMLRASSDSRYRGEASYLADKLAGQIWVDQGADQAGVANYAIPAESDPTSACTCDLDYAACQAWSAEVKHALPNGSCAVDTSLAPAVTITVSWKLPGEDASTLPLDGRPPGGNTHQLQLTTVVSD